MVSGAVAFAEPPVASKFTPMHRLKVKDGYLHLERIPIVMGIINITPDSFYENSRVRRVDEAVKRAIRFVSEGAKILDIGGQSTRPGSREIPEEEELERVIPAIEAIAKSIPGDVLISVDTYRARVAEEALKAGAHMVNDISGLTFDRDMAKVVRDYGVGIVIMHIRGTPEDMQKNPYYGDTILEIKKELLDRIEIAHRSRISDEQIIIDPGIGFGKRVYDNLLILKEIDQFIDMGYPVLIGHSRKSFIGKVLGIEKPEDRLAGSLAVATYCAMKGVHIIRTHDVLETRQAIDMIHAIENPEEFKD